jgi:hypothetical protein
MFPYVKDFATMTKSLSRCAEHLRHAVRHLANSSSTPQAKLTNMYKDTLFGSTSEGDFPDGYLRSSYLAIKALVIKADEPQAAVNIAGMSDEQALEVIGRICVLSEAVAYELGRQSNSL